MEYNIETVGQALIASLIGELDMHTCQPFKTALSKAIEEHPSAKYLILDVQRVSFIDSSGLGVILGRYKEIKGRDGKLYFAKANPQIKRVLQLAGLHKISEFIESPREVIGRLRGGN